MNTESKFARFMRNTGPARFLVPLGIVLIVFGIVMNGFNTENFVETVGRVTAVEEHVEVIDGRQETQYDVTVSFTADGKTYETVFPNLGEAPKVGGDIKVLYDPADPNRNSNSKVSKFFAPAMMGGGALVIPNFTLLASYRRGNRPDFFGSEEPGRAKELYDFFCARIETLLPHVGRGVFGAHMEVSLVNDGPLTIPMDSAVLRAPKSAF